MFSRIKTASLSGIQGSTVSVETDLTQGLPALNIVGLPDRSVSEAKERIRSAIINSGVRFPSSRITINLSPADVRKEGTHFDLPIAMGVLVSCGAVEPECLSGYAFIGELSLDGQVSQIHGALALCIELRRSGIKRIVLPDSNFEEASILKGVDFYPVRHLSELLKGTITHRISEEEKSSAFPRGGNFSCRQKHGKSELDFIEVSGQDNVKRAIQISAAGFHGILLKGPAGCGKTMLANRIPSILPPLTEAEQLEVMRIYSVAGTDGGSQLRMGQRPFRAPHHTVTRSAMAGGGAIPKPGEISLAHRGILFLDELPEFPRDVLELLRQPMEDKQIVINRSRGSFLFPSDFMLVGAMNPCPCGYFGDFHKRCTCSDTQIRKYISRLSGPLLERIDLQVEVEPVSFSDLSIPVERNKDLEEQALQETGKRKSGRIVSSNELRIGVELAWKLQQQRFQKESIHFNSQMDPRQLQKYCKMELEARRLLSKAFSYYGLSARSCERIIRLSRTIADLSDEAVILAIHMAEAIRYRCAELNQRG